MSEQREISSRGCNVMVKSRNVKSSVWSNGRCRLVQCIISIQLVFVLLREWKEKQRVIFRGKLTTIQPISDHKEVHIILYFFPFQHTACFCWVQEKVISYQLLIIYLETHLELRVEELHIMSNLWKGCLFSTISKIKSQFRLWESSIEKAFWEKWEIDCPTWSTFAARKQLHAIRAISQKVSSRTQDMADILQYKFQNAAGCLLPASVKFWPECLG